MTKTLFEELTAGLPDWLEIERISLRLIAALVLGGVIGWERERAGKAAGLRTHMLVSLASALFVVGGTAAGMSSADLSRVIQGIAAGLGFLGAGTIMKHDRNMEIEGLTTAAGIWMTAAVGVTVGLGRIGLAALAVLLGWVVLALVNALDRRSGGKVSE
ncbi:MAG: MgtC/SapB family protein [Verrucomicrobia bacterium]|nr:MgtC/SapB family protein [Verrucomicrobiota bacterium]